MEHLTEKLQEQFDKMCASGTLFVSTVTGVQVWYAYYNGFTDDPVFRAPESSTHNCKNCKNFVRRYGNILAIVDGKLVSIWDANDIPQDYVDAVQAASNILKAGSISDVFVETFEELKNLSYEACKKNQSQYQLGISANVKPYTTEEAEKYKNSDGSYIVQPNEIRTFNHLHLYVPEKFVDKSSKSVAAIQGEYRTNYQVFARMLSEVPVDSVILMRDLIQQDSLLDSRKYLPILERYISYMREYEKTNHTDLYLWERSVAIGGESKFGSSLQGQFLKEVAEGKELNEACEAYNKRIDPTNYMKAKAPITEAQKKLAEEFVVGNGYLESFNRRMATLEDIKASEILHINRDNKSKQVTIFDAVKATKSTRHKRSEFDKVEEISIDKFMADVLPNSSSVEVLLENKHEGNLVNLTTTVDPDAKPLFKWGNAFGYTFNGGLAGKSRIKDAVAAAGGKVDGVLNFRLMWNDIDGKDSSDLDVWAVEPNGNQIGFSSPYRKGRNPGISPMSGQLDVDIVSPSGKIAVENITWHDLTKMKAGAYKMVVNQYHASNSQGFKAEIEFLGEVYNYEYTGPLSGKVDVATVTLKDGRVSVEHHLPETNSSKDLWGLSTGEFHKVNLVSTTPNHWGENTVGNLHYLFMLQGCKNPNPVRGFHNEHLVGELTTHRKVLDVLGQSAMIEPTENQVAGLGFNETVRDELIVRVQGSFKRVLKLKF